MFDLKWFFCRVGGTLQDYEIVTGGAGLHLLSLGIQTFRFGFGIQTFRFGLGVQTFRFGMIFKPNNPNLKVWIPIKMALTPARGNEKF